MDRKSQILDRPSWRPRMAEGGELKSMGIVDALEADIRAGRVPPGARLPPQRAIAKALGVDLTTVTRAFNEARRRGLIDGKSGAARSSGVSRVAGPNYLRRRPSISA